MAREFSKNGYWAVAVDIFRGKTPTTLDEGRKVRESLSNAEVLDAIWNGLELLKEKAGKSVKVGTMGFCMGGGFALLAASKLGFDFCVDYYGLVQNVEEMEGEGSCSARVGRRGREGQHLGVPRFSADGYEVQETGRGSLLS